MHGGDNDGVAVVDVNGLQTYSGYTNVEQFLRRIVPPFAAAPHVLVTGVSAGGFGAGFNYHRIARLFTGAVTLIDDSGTPMSDDYLAPCLQQMWRDTWGLEIIVQTKGSCKSSNREIFKSNKMKAFKNLIFIWIVTVGFIVEMYAQDCANLSGIINTYAPVTGISGNVVTVGTTAGAAAPFAVGDYVVLIQMTGIPPVHPGSNMGNYELRLISSISRNSITLDGITKTYSPATEKVQLVRAPHCLTGTVTAKVKAKVWDGSTGGVIALHGGTLTLNANIDATATGFSQAFPPTTVITSSLSRGQGSTDGRGVDGPYLPGSGGGGIGGGGGTGTNSNTGGGVGGGGNGLGGNGLGYGYSSTSSGMHRQKTLR